MSRDFYILYKQNLSTIHLTLSSSPSTFHFILSHHLIFLTKYIVHRIIHTFQCSINIRQSEYNIHRVAYIVHVQLLKFITQDITLITAAATTTISNHHHHGTFHFISPPLNLNSIISLNCNITSLPKSKSSPFLALLCHFFFDDFVEALQFFDLIKITNMSLSLFM